jgi:hypothetical protein
MSGLSLKCASKTKAIGSFEFGRSLALRVCPICRMGGAQRCQSMAACDGDGFRCALPILRSDEVYDFCLRASLRAKAAQQNCCSVKTVMAIPAHSRSSTFCESSTPASTLTAVCIHWRCRCPCRAQKRGYGRFAFCRAIRLKGVQKNGVHRCWHELCID